MSKLTEAQDFAVKLTRYLTDQYDVDNLIINFGKGWATWADTNKNTCQIHFGAKCLLHYTTHSYTDYVKCRRIWQHNNPSNSLSAVHHLVLHEFAHILDDRECYAQSRKYTRYSPRGRRILHGKDFQRHLEELAIICPFEDVLFMS